MATNNFKGKNYDGTFKGGEGPILGQKVSSEAENGGLLSGGEGGGKNLKTVSGPAPERPSGGDGLFDLHSKSYAGPGNLAFKPDNKGTVNPFDLEK